MRAARAVLLSVQAGSSARERHSAVQCQLAQVRDALWPLLRVPDTHVQAGVSKRTSGAGAASLGAHRWSSKNALGRRPNPSSICGLSDKDTRAASATGDRPVPTIEQIDHVLELMPAATIFDRRNRALIAFTLLTGARDNAVASLRLRHLDVQRRVVFQDPRAVRTKASKAIRTWFFPVGDLAEQTVCDWVRELRDEHLWGDDDPLFPPTQIGQNLHQQFAPVGLLRSTWSNADPIRKIFGRAFELAGLPYFNPHSFRRTLARLGERLCKTPEEFKAWSQNLGHEQVLTTFSSYGSVPLHRQGEIILSLGADGTGEDADVDELIDKLAARLKKRTV